jgi:anhydro-N-acetylmuramic acid kinase
LQVLDGAALAARLGVAVVCDFRRADVALGGQGAPLAPLADLALRARPDRDRVILNLGGIANLTAIPAAATCTGQLRAGDVGPANLILDELCRRHSSHPFDPDGSLAAAGSVDLALRDAVLAEPWVRRSLPRSFGREEFGRAYTDAFERRAELTLADRLATLVEVEAQAVAIFLEELAGPWRSAPNHPVDLLVTGGGRHNAAMMQALARNLPAAEVRGIEQAGISADAKEAVDFAWLGWCALQGIASETGPITGASRPAVLGRIHPGVRSA